MDTGSTDREVAWCLDSLAWDFLKQGWVAELKSGNRLALTRGVGWSGGRGSIQEAYFTFSHFKLVPLNNPSLEENSSHPSLGCLFARCYGAREGQKVHHRSVVFPGVLTPISLSSHAFLEPQQLPKRGMQAWWLWVGRAQPEGQRLSLGLPWRVAGGGGTDKQSHLQQELRVQVMGKCVSVPPELGKGNLGLSPCPGAGGTILD